ncbi:MAG: hypothetical protein ABSG37_07785 [Candidatus Limnocylindrales bacterium]|jgi:hypothetical protein
MTTHAPGPARTRRSPATLTVVPWFDDYPFLVTRIGHTPLRHIALLPADWPRDRLFRLARRQVAANRLDTCLCLGPHEAIYIAAHGRARAAAIPPTGLPVLDRLALAEEIPATPELLERKAGLEAWARRHRGRGYIVGDGLEGGCRRLKGEYLWVRDEGNVEPARRVVAVHCRCQNRNRCARCGKPLAARRLSAYEYDEFRGRVTYWAAYCGLSHLCEAEDPHATP